MLVADTVPAMDVAEVRSFVASGFEPSWDRRQRQAYGVAKGAPIGVFVLARRAWSLEWEDYAMRAVADALDDRGLERLRLLKWHARGSGRAVGWECRPEAEGEQAEARLRELIVQDDAQQWTYARWEGVLPLWSSEDGVSGVLAEKIPAWSIGRGYPPGTANVDYQSIAFFVWGDIEGIFAALGSAALQAEGHFLQMEPPPRPDEEARSARRLPPRMATPTQPPPRRVPWSRIAVAVAVVVAFVAFFVIPTFRHRERPGSTTVERYEGIGVALDLPSDWIARSDPQELLPPIGLSDHDAEIVTAYFSDPALQEDMARLMGYEGTRTFVVFAIPLKGRQGDFSSFVDAYVADQTGRQGWNLISRGATTVDDNPAARMVFEKPANLERTLDVAWIEGDTAWLITWDTTIADFPDAEPVIDASMKTVWTESGSKG